MNIAVLIPDRGDRPGFMANCLRMMEAQTLPPTHIEVVNEKPIGEDADITYRYRVGYERLRGKGYDLIAFVENDDWYHPNYLEVMAVEWINRGKPDIIGTNYTIYYHLKLRKWCKWEHFSRASSMNTLIKPDMHFAWPPDNEPFTDIWLWNHLKGITFTPGRHISMGMKHGVGKCGGRHHVDRLEKYRNEDNGLLQITLDPPSYTFYNNLQL